MQIKNSSLSLKDLENHTEYLKVSEHIFSYAVVQNLKVINHSNLLISSDDYICKET